MPLSLPPAWAGRPPPGTGRSPADRAFRCDGEDRHPFRKDSTVQESIDINNSTGPAIIVSSAGMATGGRVLHHLRRILPDPRNAVVIVGFAAAGTRSRNLVDGARTLKMFGEYVPVRAEVADVPHFSAHADAGQVIDWLRNAPAPHTTYLVHGEETQVRGGRPGPLTGAGRPPRCAPRGPPGDGAHRAEWKRRAGGTP
ncbi:MBL fold metallo-hydrolase [Streptomyces lavendulae]|uniref:MBL fold metallo-hydrolase n=1 Tax=Streptomyces lavendulae TaxID=1914 RepID=UPI000AD968FE|nr:MBL fold metallo-hydrolase [Streptomyces lavendulae]